jgi:hypothetical protein
MSPSSLESNTKDPNVPSDPSNKIVVYNIGCVVVGTILTMDRDKSGILHEQKLQSDEKYFGK